VLGKELVRAKWNREASRKSDKKCDVMICVRLDTYRGFWCGFGLNGIERQVESQIRSDVMICVRQSELVSLTVGLGVGSG